MFERMCADMAFPLFTVCLLSYCNILASCPGAESKYCCLRFHSPVKEVLFFFSRQLTLPYATTVCSVNAPPHGQPWLMPWQCIFSALCVVRLDLVETLSLREHTATKFCLCLSSGWILASNSEYCLNFANDQPRTHSLHS